MEGREEHAPASLESPTAVGETSAGAELPSPALGHWHVRDCREHKVENLQHQAIGGGNCAVSCTLGVGCELSLALLRGLGGVDCGMAGDDREHGPPVPPERSRLQAVVHPSKGRILLHCTQTESKRFLSPEGLS